ncbi:MAG: hypothetical protein WA941_00355 [Nitrososphaeraceae archaeon]
MDQEEAINYAMSGEPAWEGTHGVLYAATLTDDGLSDGLFNLRSLVKNSSDRFLYLGVTRDLIILLVDINLE